MESLDKIKIAELRLRFVILSCNGFQTPDEEKLSAMNTDELEKEYSEIIAKIHKDNDFKHKEAIAECFTKNILALANGGEIDKNIRDMGEAVLTSLNLGFK